MVPGTNILVDSLESMKELANSGDWSIRVPTTLVIELELELELGQGWCWKQVNNFSRYFSET